MTDSELGARVKQLLADLGEDPDAIAARLVTLGVRGVRNRADACPIFCYLKANGVPVVSVDSCTIDIGDLMVTPDPIEFFIRGFDEGWYSGLVDPAAVET